MKMKNYIILIFSLLIHLHSWSSNSDEYKEVSKIIEKIKSLENHPLERAKYVAGIDHLYIARHSPQLYSHIKREYDNLYKIEATSLHLKFDITYLMEQVYFMMGEYDKSTAISYDLLKIARQTRDSLQYYYAYSAIATNEDEFGNRERSIQFYLRAKKYASVDQKSLCAVNIDLGISYLSQQKYELAKDYIENAIAIAIQEKDDDNLSYSYSIMMDYFYYQEDLKQSLDYFEKINALIKKNPLLEKSRVVINVNIRAAEIYSEQEAYLKSDAHFEITYALAKKANDRPNISTIYDSRSHVEEVRGNYAQSLVFLRKYISLDDSIYNEATTSQINALKVTFELEKKDLEIAARIAKAKSAKKQFWFWIIGGLLFFAGLIVLAMYLKTKLNASILREKLIKEEDKVNKNEIENLAREVQLKNKKLADLFLHQFEKATLLNDVIESVDQSSAKLKHALQEHQDQQKDWINFKSHFDQVHEGFFEKLNNLSSELTPKDIRFCAYIRMNLSAKEIAIMLGISHRTVEGIRGRVRKKLNLSAHQDLVLFLMSI